MGVGSFFQKLAPWLSAGVQFIPGAGPSIAGIITKIAGDHAISLPGAVEGTAASIGDAVAAMTGNSAAMLALKQADQQYAEQMQAIGFKQITDIQALDNADRASARERQIAVKDRTPSVLAAVITITALLVVYLVFSGHADSVLSIPATAAIAGAIVGYVFKDYGQVLNYYFGSSQGSKEKTKIIGDIAKEP